FFLQSSWPGETRRSRRRPVASCQYCACARQQLSSANVLANFFHLPPSFSSTPLMRAASSGSRPYHANNSLNFSSERAGVPQTVSPPRIVFPPSTPLCPPITDLSSNLHRSPKPAWPPTTTCFPNTHEPDKPA